MLLYLLYLFYDYILIYLSVRKSWIYSEPFRILTYYTIPHKYIRKNRGHIVHVYICTYIFNQKNSIF